MGLVDFSHSIETWVGLNTRLLSVYIEEEPGVQKVSDVIMRSEAIPVLLKYAGQVGQSTTETYRSPQTNKRPLLY